MPIDLDGMLGNTPEPSEKATPYFLHYHQLLYPPHHLVKLVIVFVSSAKFQKQ